MPLFRKVLLSITLLTAGLSGMAQHCSIDSVSISPGTGTSPGFIPSSDSLACIVNDSIISDILYFTNYSQFAAGAVSTLTIDSIENLPAGICWVSNKASNQFGPGENGIIYLSGTCSSTPGQYKLHIIMSGTVGTRTFSHEDAEVIAGLRYYVRVVCPGSPCEPLDSTDGMTMPYIPYTAQIPCAVDTTVAGISEAGHHSTHVVVAPDPFSTTAVLSFDTDMEGDYTISIVSLIGEELSSRTIHAIAGHTALIIDRKGIAAGMYILSVSSQGSAVNKKIVIE